MATVTFIIVRIIRIIIPPEPSPTRRTKLIVLLFTLRKPPETPSRLVYLLLMQLLN
jgi:hypothetical protein